MLLSQAYCDAKAHDGSVPFIYVCLSCQCRKAGIVRIGRGTSEEREQGARRNPFARKALSKHPGRAEHTGKREGGGRLP